MKISEKDFETLRDFIYSVCGIYFQSSKKYFLESRVVQRMAEARTGQAKTDDTKPTMTDIRTMKRRAQHRQTVSTQREGEHVCRQK